MIFVGISKEYMRYVLGVILELIYFIPLEKLSTRGLEGGTFLEESKVDFSTSSTQRASNKLKTNVFR